MILQRSSAEIGGEFDSLVTSILCVLHWVILIPPCSHQLIQDLSYFFLEKLIHNFSKFLAIVNVGEA